MSTSQKQLSSTENLNDDDTFRIMLATDIHLGHAIDNPIRHMDTFVTFEVRVEIFFPKTIFLLGNNEVDKSK